MSQKGHEIHRFGPGLMECKVCGSRHWRKGSGPTLQIEEAIGSRATSPQRWLRLTTEFHREGI